MEILKAKLENAIGRAEEYRLLGKNHPEGLNVHIQYITDLIKPLIGSLRCQSTLDEEAENKKLFAAAKTTLKNLRSELAAAERGAVCPAISKLRKKLEGLSGQPLLSFDGGEDQYFEFRSNFLHSVSKDVSMSGTEKLILLKSCLVKEPFDFVDAFPTSSANYLLARDLLDAVYGTTREGLPELYRRLNQLPRVSMSDGAKFRKTYLQLENILQSLSEHLVEVNENLAVKFLYLRKFDERTCFSLLNKEVDMSLPEIRREIRHLSNVDELYLEAKDAADDIEGSVPLEERPVVSQISSNQPANIDARREVARTAANGNKSTTSKQNTRKKSATQTSSQSCELNSIKRREAFEMSLPTFCTKVVCPATNKTTSLRFLFQEDAKISLMTENAAKRLGIQVPQKKTLRLRTSDLNFTATLKYFSLKLSVGTWDESCTVYVHIVDDSFSAQDVPGADIDEFRKKHPDLSHLELLDTGKGRPIDVFLCGCNYQPKLLEYSFPVKPNWQLQKSLRFGWYVQGPVKKNDRQISYSYWFPDNYEVPYSELRCQHF